MGNPDLEILLQQVGNEMNTTKSVDELLTGLVFMTGSQLYGTPRIVTADGSGAEISLESGSDIDLVVRMPIEVANQLAAADPLAVMSRLESWRNATVFRFGRLNLLAIHDDKALEAWQKATAICYAARPVTREAALNIHKRERKEAGVEFDDHIVSFAEGDYV